MDKHLVAVGKYEKSLASVQTVVQMANGQRMFKKGLRVCIKPNIIENHESLPGALMKYHEHRPEFEPGHFKIK